MPTELTPRVMAAAINTQLDHFKGDAMDAIDSIDPNGPYEDMLMVNEMVLFFKRLATEMKKASDAKFIEVIKAQGDVEIGDKRYYYGLTTKWTCSDPSYVLEVLLDELDNNMDKVASAFSSDPFKSGTVKGLIGEALHKELFVKTFKDKLETGKPKKSLKVIDKKFVK